MINEITKESLQEKTIYQSLIYFTSATEMRFQEASQESSPISRKNSKDDYGRPKERKFRNSEAYHLKAIELVCRYITGPCPYINHLITSYQKHYNQDLETIPEESFISDSVSNQDFNLDLAHSEPTKTKLKEGPRNEFVRQS